MTTSTIPTDVAQTNQYRIERLENLLEGLITETGGFSSMSKTEKQLAKSYKGEIDMLKNKTKKQDKRVNHG